MFSPILEEPPGFARRADATQSLGGLGIDELAGVVDAEPNSTDGLRE